MIYVYDKCSVYKLSFLITDQRIESSSRIIIGA